jgi:hypothetical protein
MNGFLYFLEGLPAAPQEAVERAGLLDQVTVSYQQVHCDTGPGGTHGVVVANTDAGRAGYVPGAQEWKHVGGKWIGWWKKARPEPQDLERGEVRQGYAVTMPDGNKWNIPIGRTAAGDTTLATQFVVGADGNFTEVVEERWEGLRALAERLHRIFVDNAEPSPGNAELCKAACEILAVNYRVSAVEVSALGLLTAQSVALICLAFIDYVSIAKVKPDDGV